MMNDDQNKYNADVNIIGTEILDTVVAKLQSERQQSITEYHSINLKEEINKNKNQLRNILLKTVSLEENGCLINNEILFKTKEFQLKKDVLKNEIAELNENQEFDMKDTPKLKKLQRQMINLKDEEKHVLNTLKIQMSEKHNQTIAKIESLRELKNVLTEEHFTVINKLEILKMQSTKIEEKAKKIDKQITQIENNFQEQMNNIDELEKRLLRTVKARSSEFLSFDDPNSSLSSSDDSSQLASSQACENKNKTDYIKSVLGKALVRGLTAITLYQPSDPIHYLANFLLHHHNEINSIENQKAFEDLMYERNRYATTQQMKATGASGSCSCEPSDNVIQ